MEEELIFSEHGKERLLERLKCNKNKVEKIVRKAFDSKCDGIPSCWKYLLKKKGEENSFYRYYLGYIFIFALVADGVLFVTLYNPKVSGKKGTTSYERKNIAK